MNRCIIGDCLDVLPTLESGSVQMCVTSPPYWGLRDYGCAGQLGLESTPQEYVENMVRVFREVRRVLRDDGTLWLNLGDSYARDVAKGGSGPNGKHDFIPDYGNARKIMSESKGSSDGAVGRGDRAPIRNGAGDLKPKDLVGIPWRVAFALQADGWYLRQDIIWSKPNPMPESVRDRCTKSHEYIFLLSKSERYYFDADAIHEDGPTYIRKAGGYVGFDATHTGTNQKGGLAEKDTITTGRNKRSVWTVTTKPFSGAHFATFPPDLIEPCILAGSKPGDLVLDPFGGSGTTGQVAEKLGRKWLLIELNPEYEKLSRERTAQQGMVFS